MPAAAAEAVGFVPEVASTVDDEVVIAIAALVHCGLSLRGCGHDGGGGSIRRRPRPPPLVGGGKLLQFRLVLLFLR